MTYLTDVQRMEIAKKNMPGTFADYCVKRKRDLNARLDELRDRYAELLKNEKENGAEPDEHAKVLLKTEGDELKKELDMIISME